MTLPLFERFPGTASLPRVGLCTLPTPLAPLPIDGAPAGLMVKRDDLTSALYGGNKVRKLEFLLGQALAEKRTSVLTFGAYGSNHALATAVHARALGLEPHVVLSPQAPGPFAAATLRAHAGLGTVVHPVDGWDGRREAVIAKRAARPARRRRAAGDPDGRHERRRRDGLRQCRARAAGAVSGRRTRRRLRGRRDARHCDRARDRIRSRRLGHARLARFV